MSLEQGLKSHSGVGKKSFEKTYDLIILKSFLLSSGCCMPRSEAIVKRCLGAFFSEPAVEVLSFLDRTESERFLSLYQHPQL